MHIYPSNLKARAALLFWTLRDIAIAVVLTLLGILALTQTGSPIVLAVAAGFAFLSIRFDDNSILDFLRRAWRFTMTRQQFFKWRRTIDNLGVRF